MHQSNSGGRWQGDRNRKQRRHKSATFTNDDEDSDRESVLSAISNVSHKSNFKDRCDKPNSTKNEGNRNRFYGYKYLEEWSNKEAHQIVVEILKPHSPFNTYLEKQELNTDWLFLIMKIMKVVCVSGFVGNKEEILSHFCKSQLLHVTSFYLGEVGMEKNKNTIKNLNSFMGDLTEFYMAVIDTLPSVAFEKDFEKLIKKTKFAIGIVCSNLEVNIDEKIVEKLDVLSKRLNDYKNIIEKRTTSKKQHFSMIDTIANCPPPENFRELSLYPTDVDLFSWNFGFVRPNKTKGAYDDVEHYLDVQFRLLREDFIDPLRRGVKKYLEAKRNAGKMKYKHESIRLYTKSQFEHIENSKSNVVGYVVKFDSNNRMKNMKWEYSKRFMYGSLLLFTNDDFRTFFYGTVVERDLNKLKAGKILVGLAEGVEVTQEFFSNSYLMVESEVFFEPYFLVMKLLKGLNEDTFPMKRYIVKGEANTEPPVYVYNFKTWNILGHQLRNMEMNRLNIHAYYWPLPDALGMDIYQHTAFVTALTNDFCVIQGPPGTGKTFIGLKIVEVLLKNIALNPDAIKTPILVVCFTNHALDQFLEGILTHTKKLVRIGGQSRSETLQPFNLRGKNNLLHVRSSVKHIFPMMNQIRINIKTCREKIDRFSKEKINIEKPIGILQLKYLNRVLLFSQKQFFHSDEDLAGWLLNVDVGDAEDEEEKKIQFRSDNKTNLNAENLNESPIDEDDIDDDNEDALVNDDEIFQPSTESTNADPNNVYSITLENLGRECQMYIDRCQYVNEHEKESAVFFEDYSAFYNYKQELRKTVKTNVQKYLILRDNLDKPVNNPEKVNLLLKKDMKHLGVKDRWLIYWNWVTQLRNEIIEKLKAAEADCRSKMVQYEEVKQIEDLHVVQKALVVGMTTTGAARLQTLLKTLNPAIVIVEEAAEVLEAHIVASLTHRCQHVILIGDHKQLKPSAAVYELSKNYGIDVSLFERMINNGMYCPNLNVQHRMRPEISCLITPLIYPDLKNHASVLDYKSISGVSRSVFFLEHNVYEEIVEDTSSKKNIFEAGFMLELCRYLVLQGYSPSNITILTTYTGQMFLLREQKKQYPLLKEVKCIVVDKYQGEENQIILLSLVRSNAEAKIGFLSIENRVCVALSRAKEGLYIIGNMDNLAKSSKLWTEIKKTLTNQNAIGKALVLFCEKHHKHTLVSTKNDFDKVREGGCNEYCGELMPCGHNCKSLCHKIDEQHLEMKCRERCQKTCPRLHPCPLFCYQECRRCTVIEERTLPCGHKKKFACYLKEKEYLCDVQLDDISKLCNHKVIRKCSEKAEDVICTTDCEYRLECGHACPQKCHKKNDPDHLHFKCKRTCEKTNKDCSKEHKCQKLCFEECGRCTVMENFQLTCGHKLNLQCSTDISKINCSVSCMNICGICKRKCKKLCHEPCEPCINKVEKIIPECGHKIKVKCSEIPTRENCRERCKLNAPCGHKCKSVCAKPCGTDKCVELVKSTAVFGLCGHNYVNVFCYQKREINNINEEEFLPNCDAPCNVILQCGDVCSGNCGKCWQRRLHTACQNQCGSLRICGHSCKFPCRQVCPPCDEPCSYRCKHSKCSKKCGIPCTPCVEKCDWHCKHNVCTRNCDALCDRKPCYEPCPKVVKKCQHPCIGFCGEPCPPLCRICDEEVTTIMFGYEDEEDARFVLLEDCNHVIESRAMEQHLQNSEEPSNKTEIVMKVCPLCKTPIAKTLRFMNYVKKTYHHIISIKKKIYGDDKTMIKTRNSLTNKLQKLLDINEADFNRAGLGKVCQIIKKFLKIVRITKRKHAVSNNELVSINYFYEVFFEIASRLKELLEINEIVAKIIKATVFIIDRIDSMSANVNKQQINDLNNEMKRFHKKVDFSSAIRNNLNTYNKTDPVVVRIRINIERILFGPKIFGLEEENTIDGLFKDFQRELKSNKPLTSEEKRMINLAMSKDFMNGSASTGHWFTCSKGHYYVITECGGAMEKSNCPECGEEIGGTNHRYVPTARLAKDMDGATRPAWSTGNDMGNYQFDF